MRHDLGGKAQEKTVRGGDHRQDFTDAEAFVFADNAVQAVFVGILNLPLPRKSRACNPHRVDGNDNGFGLVGQNISRCDVGDGHGDIPLGFGLADKK